MRFADGKELAVRDLTVGLQVYVVPTDRIHLGDPMNTSVTSVGTKWLHLGLRTKFRINRKNNVYLEDIKVYRSKLDYEIATKGPFPGFVVMNTNVAPERSCPACDAGIPRKPAR